MLDYKAKNEPTYLKTLDDMLEDIYDVSTARGWTYKRFSAESGISARTISRLGNYVTRRPMLRTIVKLATAVGMRVTIQKHSVQARRAM